jgi:hypothetical protein
MPRRKTPDDYPEWICHDCGVKYGYWYKNSRYRGPKYWSATYHLGTCDMCKSEEISVTEPRDYGHLNLDRR